MGTQIETFRDTHAIPPGTLLTVIQRDQSAIWLIGEIDLALDRT